MVKPNKAHVCYSGGMKHRQFSLTSEEGQALEAVEGETGDARTLRRLQGIRLYGSGLDMGMVKQVTGAARRTVEDWVTAYRAAGIGGLKPGWAGGNNRKLTAEARAAVGVRLGAMTVEQALGRATTKDTPAFWSIETVGQAVEQGYGVRYASRESYRRLLSEAGFSFQQPEGIYRSRPSEAVIADFEADAEKK